MGGIATQEEIMRKPLVRFRTYVQGGLGLGAFFWERPLEKTLRVLSPMERAACYRQFAAEALGRAADTESASAKGRHLDMAARWDSLAQDIERRLELLD